MGGFFLFLISCFIFLTFQTQKILFFQTPRFSFQNSDSFFSLRHTSNIPSPWVGTILIYQRYFSQIQDLDSEEGGEENAQSRIVSLYFSNSADPYASRCRMVSTMLFQILGFEFVRNSQECQVFTCIEDTHAEGARVLLRQNLVFLNPLKFLA